MAFQWVLGPLVGKAGAPSSWLKGRLSCRSCEAMGPPSPAVAAAVTVAPHAALAAGARPDSTAGTGHGAPCGAAARTSGDAPAHRRGGSEAHRVRRRGRISPRATTPRAPARGAWCARWAAAAAEAVATRGTAGGRNAPASSREEIQSPLHGIDRDHLYVHES